MSNFDYGPVKPSGQYTRYPSSVLTSADGSLAFKQPIRNAYRHKKCGTITFMQGNDLCLTYATNPGFYGATFCCGCGEHLPLSEFVWSPDGAEMAEVSGEPGKDLRREL